MLLPYNSYRRSFPFGQMYKGALQEATPTPLQATSVKGFDLEPLSQPQAARDSKFSACVRRSYGRLVA